MKIYLFFILFYLQFEAIAQVVQGCPTCPPKLLVGENEEEYYREQAMVEMLNLKSLDLEITSLVLEQYKKYYPQSKVEIKNIVNVYSFLVFAKVDHQSHCKNCLEGQMIKEKILNSEIKEKLKLFLGSKYLRSYLYDQYNQSNNEMDAFIKGMEKFK